MTVPTKAELEELHEIVLDGDMDKITANRDKLEQKDKKLKVFCDQFRTPALGYQDEKIVSLLKKTFRISQEDIDETIE